MNEGEVTAYTVEARGSSDKPRTASRGDYLSVPLPDQIESLGYALGDEVRVKLDTHIFQNKDITYLRVSKESIQTRHNLKIRHNPDLNPEHFIRIPVEYTDHTEDQPFHLLERGDKLSVEIDESVTEIRIYTPLEYTKRTEELAYEGRTPRIEKPIVVPIISRLLRRPVNIARQTKFPGEKFRFYFVDIESSVINRIGRMLEKSADDYQYEQKVDHNITKELDGDDLPFKRVEAFEIKWGPNPGKGQPLEDNELETVYKDNYLKNKTVILPKKGAYLISLTTEAGIRSARLGYRRPEGLERQDQLMGLGYMRRDDGKILPREWFSQGLWKMDITPEGHIGCYLFTPSNEIQQDVYDVKTVPASAGLF